MKILVVQNNNGSMGAFQYITQGIINAFNTSGHTAIRWDGAPQSWSNFKPDIYLGCSGHRQPIPTKKLRGDTIIGIHVNPFGKDAVGSVDGGPILDEPDHAIEWTLQQNPDFVFCYCSDTFIPQYYGNWTSLHKLKVIQMPCAADTTIFKPSKLDTKFECDIGWIGGYWGYKAKMLDVYIVPLLSKYNCKIYGWGGWNNNQKINDNDVPKLFASAKICPSVSEPHSSVHPFDIPERVFKVPAAGGFTIHSPSPAISDLFGDAVPMAKDATEWFQLIDYYLQNNELRNRMAARQRRAILARHTYFDRCANILAEFGFKKEAEDMLNQKWL